MAKTKHAKRCMGQHHSAPIAEVLESRVLLSGGALLQSTVSLPNGGTTYFGLTAVVGNKIVYLTDFPSAVATLYDADTKQLSLLPTPNLTFEPSAATAVGQEAIFAGGVYENAVNEVPSAGVEIYHVDTGQWSSASLSQARYSITAVGVGNLAIFAGGDTAFQAPSAEVDLFDGATQRWSTSTLPVAADDLQAAAVGSVAVFADGKQLQIYDTSTGQWSVVTLPQERTNFAFAAVGDDIVEAGGYYTDRRGFDRLQNSAFVYDLATGHQFLRNISQGSYGLQGVTVGSQAVFVTSQISSNPPKLSKVAAYLFDGATGKFHAIANPPGNGQLGRAAALGDQAVFLGELGNSTTLYDPATGQWRVFEPVFGGLIPTVMDGHIVCTEEIFDYTDSYPSQTSVQVFSLDNSSPVSLSPAGGAVLTTRRPSFSWTAVPGATSYDVYLDAPTNSNPLAEVTGTQFTPSAPITGGSHEWYVVANTPGGTTSSATQTFTIAAPVLGLRVTYPDLPQTLTTSVTGTVVAFVTNYGNRPTDEPFVVQIALDNVESGGTIVLGQRIITQQIAPGTRIKVHIAISLAQAPVATVLELFADVQTLKRSAAGGLPDILDQDFYLPTPNLSD